MGSLPAAQELGGRGFGPGFSTPGLWVSGQVLLWGGQPRSCHRHLALGVCLEEEHTFKLPSLGRSAILPRLYPQLPAQLWPGL